MHRKSNGKGASCIKCQYKFRFAIRQHPNIQMIGVDLEIWPRYNWCLNGCCWLGSESAANGPTASGNVMFLNAPSVVKTQHRWARRCSDALEQIILKHCGSLCKNKMAAACARTLSKVGWHILESPACRPGNISSLVPNYFLHGTRRAYGTGGAGFRSKLSFASPLRAGGRVLGCAFLLGGGLGLYQTIKFSVQHHLAEGEAKVFLYLQRSIDMCMYNAFRILTNIWHLCKPPPYRQFSELSNSPHVTYAPYMWPICQ